MRYLLIIVLAASLLSGCAYGRKWSLNLAESDTKNAEAVRDVSREIMNGWPTWSGMLAGILGDRIKDFPVRAVEAWNQLDMITCCNDSSKYPSSFCPKCIEFTLDDYTLGYYGGTRIRMLAETVIEAFKTCAPDLVGQLPGELLAIL
jgi:hypothetical protein